MLRTFICGIKKCTNCFKAGLKELKNIIYRCTSCGSFMVQRNYNLYTHSHGAEITNTTHEIVYTPNTLVTKLSCRSKKIQHVLLSLITFKKKLDSRIHFWSKIHNDIIWLHYAGLCQENVMKVIFGAFKVQTMPIRCRHTYSCK